MFVSAVMSVRGLKTPAFSDVLLEDFRWNSGPASYLPAPFGLTALFIVLKLLSLSGV